MRLRVVAKPVGFATLRGRSASGRGEGGGGSRYLPLRRSKFRRLPKREAGNLLPDIFQQDEAGSFAAVGLSHILSFPGPARADPHRYFSDCSRED
jgi:hypothetical protein